MNLRTCVDPSGKFIYIIHNPAYRVHNFRQQDDIRPIGWDDERRSIDNRANFPHGDVEAPDSGVVYEIPNPFPFRGATFILKKWADEKARCPDSISLPRPATVSFSDSVKHWAEGIDPADGKIKSLLTKLPSPIRHAVAAVTTDPDDLRILAGLSCDFVFDDSGHAPLGIRYRADAGGIPRPVIHDHLLYEIAANNPALPDIYKEVMVLRPGVQGKSEIVGEWRSDSDKSHIFEYLRRNSYIPGGHFAANMAHDAVRYRAMDLTAEDMEGLRRLYYQRTYVRLAADLGLPMPPQRKAFSIDALESLRLKIREALSEPGRPELSYNRSLWGWNFGFDYAPSGYRLHASHQQIHQQFALIPARGISDGLPDETFRSVNVTPYACGDMIADFIDDYQKLTGKDFFETYITAIYANQRMDGKNKEKSLVVHSDPNVMLFVPKAQTSQWEIQLMTKPPVGNILEADSGVRKSLDTAILIAARVLEQLGAKMITCIEYSKAFDSRRTGQRLLYAFLPRLPESPGAFSEAQLRWINGHYPEDFAAACRRRIPEAFSNDF